MNIAIIASTKDPAGMNIYHTLLPQFEKTDEQCMQHDVYALRCNGGMAGGDHHVKLFLNDIDTVYIENIDTIIKDAGFAVELIIFATQHEAASGIASLSAHGIGNWSDKTLGGKQHTLCACPADLLKFAIQTLEKYRAEEHEKNPDFDFQLIQEVTHHGPYIETPSIFIEIGSSDAEWKREDAGNVLARTIMHILTNPIPPCKIAIGFGGLHHMPSFMKVILSSEYALGHVCPKYFLEQLKLDEVRQAVEKTIALTSSEQKVEIAVLDWKGLGVHKNHILALLEELKLPNIRTRAFQNPE